MSSLVQEAFSAAAAGNIAALSQCFEKHGDPFKLIRSTDDDPSALAGSRDDGSAEGSSLAALNADGASFLLLHIAAERGHASCVEFLLQCPGEVNPSTAVSRSTPLHLAAWHGHEKVCEVILAASKVEAALARDSDGRTALCLARLGKHRKVTKLLKHWFTQCHDLGPPLPPTYATPRKAERVKASEATCCSISVCEVSPCLTLAVGVRATPRSFQICTPQQLSSNLFSGPSNDDGGGDLDSSLLPLSWVKVKVTEAPRRGSDDSDDDSDNEVGGGGDNNENIDDDLTVDGSPTPLAAVAAAAPFRIKRRHGAATTGQPQLLVVRPKDFPLVVGGLAPGTTYRVAVAATNCLGAGPYGTGAGVDDTASNNEESGGGGGGVIVAGVGRQEEEEEEEEGGGGAQGNEQGLLAGDNAYMEVRTPWLLAAFVRRCFAKLGASDLPHCSRTFPWHVKAALLLRKQQEQQRQQKQQQAPPPHHYQQSQRQRPSKPPSSSSSSPLPLPLPFVPWPCMMAAVAVAAGGTRPFYTPAAAPEVAFSLTVKNNKALRASSSPARVFFSDALPSASSSPASAADSAGWILYPLLRVRVEAHLKRCFKKHLPFVSQPERNHGNAPASDDGRSKNPAGAAAAAVASGGVGSGGARKHNDEGNDDEGNGDGEVFGWVPCEDLVDFLLPLFAGAAARGGLCKAAASTTQHELAANGNANANAANTTATPGSAATKHSSSGDNPLAGTPATPFSPSSGGPRELVEEVATQLLAVARHCGVEAKVVTKLRRRRQRQQETAEEEEEEEEAADDDGSFSFTAAQAVQGATEAVVGFWLLASRHELSRQHHQLKSSSSSSSRRELRQRSSRNKSPSVTSQQQQQQQVPTTPLPLRDRGNSSSSSSSSRSDGGSGSGVGDKDSRRRADKEVAERSKSSGRGDDGNNHGKSRGAGGRKGSGVNAVLALLERVTAAANAAANADTCVGGGEAERVCVVQEEEGEQQVVPAEAARAKTVDGAGAALAEEEEEEGALLADVSAEEADMSWALSELALEAEEAMTSSLLSAGAGGCWEEGNFGYSFAYDPSPRSGGDDGCGVGRGRGRQLSALSEERGAGSRGEQVGGVSSPSSLSPATVQILPGPAETRAKQKGGGGEAEGVRADASPKGSNGDGGGGSGGGGGSAVKRFDTAMDELAFEFSEATKLIEAMTPTTATTAMAAVAVKSTWEATQEIIQERGGVEKGQHSGVVEGGGAGAPTTPLSLHPNVVDFKTKLAEKSEQGCHREVDTSMGAAGCAPPEDGGAVQQINDID